MYFSLSQKPKNLGFSLVEIIVTAAIVSLVFGGLLASVKFALDLVGRSKASYGALSLANERMEYIRSLPYDSVGTIGSPPYGLIPQTSTTTLNGIVYTERVLITYIDDPADGSDGSDENANIDDYKLVKVVYTWDTRDGTDTLSLISNIVPIGIESITGGGTIRVNVFDAAVLPVDSASVHFLNTTLPTTTDTTRFTNTNGVAFLSGAPAGGNYEITVTKAGYSTSGTYVATTSNPIPTTPPVSVASSSVSTMTFFIDAVSDVLIQTVDPAVIGTFEDLFDTSAKIGTTSNTTIVGGGLQLVDTLGVYELTGTALSTSTTPGAITSWESMYFNASVSASTTARVSLYYDDAGTMTWVPVSDVPGNDVGFISSPIDISSLDIATYPTLGLGAGLTTIDTSETPILNEWGLTYTISESAIPNINFRLFGQKVIGSDASLQSIFKYDQTHTTYGSGEVQLTDMEWDVYDVELITPGYDIAEACAPLPYVLNPGVSEVLTMTLTPSASEALKVLVTKADSTPLAGATVRLENAGIDQTIETSLCGQTFFNSGLYADPNYTVTVSKTGYTTEVQTGIDVTTSTSSIEVVLNP